MSIEREVEAIIVDVREAVLDGADDFDEVDKEGLFAIALACFTVARMAAVAASGSEENARAWFKSMIERWRNTDGMPANPK